MGFEKIHAYSWSAFDNRRRWGCEVGRIATPSVQHANALHILRLEDKLFSIKFFPICTNEEQGGRNIDIIREACHVIVGCNHCIVRFPTRANP